MKVLNKIRNSDRLEYNNIKESIDVAFNSEKALLKWSSSEETKNNFGDALNPWLFEKITGTKPQNANKIINFSNKKIYSCIGSILDNNRIRNLVVWGSGFKEKDSKFVNPPVEITAVRGPLSRNNVIKQGIECPEVYGDPALLLPKYYNPSVEKKYELGLIAHYVDKDNENYKKFIETLPETVLIIDIEDKIENVVDNILQCNKIASSSLHGIIVADAYNIPSLFIKFSNDVVGGNFKFKDYMASVKREFKDPLVITKDTSFKSVLSSFYDYTIEINLDKLLDACPFYNGLSSMNVGLD